MRKFIPIYVVIVSCFIACQLSDEQTAEKYVATARNLVQTGQWRQARIVLDSLHTLYPRQVEMRKNAKILEDSITYLEAQKTLEYVDTILPPLLSEVDKLLKKFKYDKNQKYEDEGKYVHKLLNTTNNTSRNFLQAYVSSDKKTILKSYYYGNRQVNQQKIKLYANGEEVVFVGRNHHFYDVAHHEIMTLAEADALSLLNFVNTHQYSKIRVEGLGGKPTHNWVYYLNDKEKQALSDTYKLGFLMSDISKLERMQRVANAQVNRFNQAN